MFMRIPLAIYLSQDSLDVRLWEHDRYAGAEWKLPQVIDLSSIDCHVGRQTINLRGTNVWATIPLLRVSKWL